MRKVLAILLLFIIVAFFVVATIPAQAASAAEKKSPREFLESSCASTSRMVEHVMEDLGRGKAPEQIVMFYSATISALFRKQQTAPFHAEDRQWLVDLVAFTKKGKTPEEAQVNCLKEKNLLNPRDRIVLSYKRKDAGKNMAGK